MDLFGIPDSTKADVQYFYVNIAATTATNLRVWTKPMGRSFLEIIAIGGGGGGGGGRGDAAGTARGGGGGGGAGAISRYIYPMWVLPDVLYVGAAVHAAETGTGGAGGSSADGVNGTNGPDVGVAMYPHQADNNWFAFSNGGSGGGGGTAAASGISGGGGFATANADNPFANWSITTSIAGVAGSVGGTPAGSTGGDITLGTSSMMIIGGTGGGGCTSIVARGGNINGTANDLFIQNPGGSAAAIDGSPGFKHGQFPVFYGGTGGCSSNVVTGGAGGYGCVPGAGGGGGGAGVTVGGRGGDGGPGLVIMISW